MKVCYRCGYKLLSKEEKEDEVCSSCDADYLEGQLEDSARERED